MHRPGIRLSTPAALLLCALTSLSPAQEPPARPAPPTALQAITQLKLAVRDPELNRIVEISGHGAPAPTLWAATVYNAISPTGMVAFQIQGRRAEELGANRDFYPEHLPEGFFQLSRVKVDSAEAFRIADKEAGNARIGFDRLDYRLRCREFATEPMWSIRLRDAEDQLVGSVELSAESGKVLRAVWLYRNPDSGRIIISDSAWPDGLKLPPGGLARPVPPEDDPAAEALDPADPAGEPVPAGPDDPAIPDDPAAPAPEPVPPPAPGPRELPPLPPPPSPGNDPLPPPGQVR